MPERLVESESNESKFHQIKEVLDDEKIEGVVFDWNGTIVDSSEISLRKSMVLRMLKGVVDSEKSKADLEYIFQTHDKASLKNFGLAPERWFNMLNDIAQVYPQIYGVVFNESLNILQDINYLEFPPAHRALEVIRLMHDAKRKTAVLTMTEPNRLRTEMTRLGIADMINITYSVIGNKSEEVWKDCAYRLGINPENAMAVGDGWVEDATAAYLAGYKKAVWIDSGNIRHILEAGKYRGGTDVVGSIAELPEKILSWRRS